MRMAAIVALVLLAACGSSGPTATASPTPTVASPSPSLAPSPSPSEIPSPTPSAAPTPSPVVSPSPGCATLSGGTASRAVITDVRIGSHPGYDRVVVEFSGGLPYYRMFAQDPSTFVGPASGQPISVAGHAGVHLIITDMDIPPSFPHGQNLKPGYTELQQVVVMAVFEGQADIAIGLDHSACPVVSLFSGPPRLVIDFPTS